MTIQPFYFDDEPEEEGEEKQNDRPKSWMEKMMESRTIMLFGEINMKVAREMSEKLLLMANESDDPITLYVNSPGGHVESGDTIFDMIRYIKPRVRIVGTGWVASAGALIYASVPVEDRYTLPHTRYMIHQPLGGVRGQAADIAIEAEEIMKMRGRLEKIFAEQTGQPLDQVKQDMERNFWMSATEAQEYGLVGKIINDATDLD
ncbi:MAG: ATP-dependent Clp protease proteolytic subunit [Ardenticatenaceae bacterium]|nr:ATP-dependent Clp protease proteolytic subunit [Ardenticatenaceae bacterium]